MIANNVYIKKQTKKQTKQDKKKGEVIGEFNARSFKHIVRSGKRFSNNVMPEFFEKVHGDKNTLFP